MCDYLSFLVSSDKKGPHVGRLYFADLLSHSETAEAHQLEPETYREVEWVGDEPRHLEVRALTSADARWYRQLILDRYSTRTALMSAIPAYQKLENGSFKYEASSGVFKTKLFNGSKRWYLHGKPHREDGPAVEYANGTKEWWLHGKLHRKDGPAIEWPDGPKKWYLHGKRHRKDGPAVEEPNGYKAWYLHGRLHREDGPAVEWPDGYKAWYLHGEFIKNK